jgi:glycosyltransferase involved in cell wall biosynthesis
VFDLATAAKHLVILIPVYNDWEALSLLLLRVDRELATHRLHTRIFLIDDGSTVIPSANCFSSDYRSIQTIDVLSLRRNLGHQRAIAAGLSYIEANVDCQYLVIMDGDGEDEPSDIPQLLHKCIMSGNKIVFAARTRRSEGWVFKFLYQLYRLVHFSLTGIRVRVGNFSVVPAITLKKLVAVSELWNHYAAAVHKAKLPVDFVPTARGCRLAGPAQMDIVALVVHGLSAMAVFGDRIGVRLLLAVFIGMLLNVAALLSVIAVRLLTSWAIPGWATYAAGILLVILVQMSVVVLVFVFVILASRDRVNFIPARDYVHMAGAVQRVYGQAA